ncbi:TetR/AcrR family transcriptional regulator [Pseudomonas sp. LABIM340]|uniref:TetR/AcrR family transcriptional regulator n=1 Tax=Pseudomonas sp. LABIM340 TaxID=3156585 RepID=UPI0032AEB08D
MSGLREQQKQERRQVIAEAALEVFIREGYEAATIDQIAAAARVSPPTVTNYYAGGKPDILIALLRAPDEKVLSEHLEHAFKLENPIDAMCFMEDLITENQLRAMPRHLWREIGPMLVGGAGAAIFKAWNDSTLNAAREFFHLYQNRGIFRSDFDVDFAAGLFSDLLNVEFMRLATSETADRDAHRTHIRKMYEFLGKGFLSASS